MISVEGKGSNGVAQRLSQQTGRGHSPGNHEGTETEIQAFPHRVRGHRSTPGHPGTTVCEILQTVTFYT